jgi:cell division protein FtsL
MAVPQRRYQVSAPAEQVLWPVPKKTRGLPARPSRAARRKEIGRRRRFAVLVVIPVLLLLGSVYLHTVSGAVEARIAGLEERLARAQAEGERLEVRVAELSRAERIRTLATERLGMEEPGAWDLKVYGTEGEDGTPNGGEEKGGKRR